MGESELTLILGNKNHSSWSLRAWLALRATGAPFREVKILLDEPDTHECILRYSPSGRVPALIDGKLVLWESLAICEHLAERFPSARLWPEEPEAKALARSVAAEMHAGFADMRREMSMNLRARIPGRTLSPAARRDVERVCAIWRECRERFGAGGAMLFGRFTIADCMFAPVASRFVTYATPLDPVCAAYRDAVLALPAMDEWRADAETERELPDH